MIGNERSFDIGTSKDDNPSATAHGEAVGAVHTYALAENKQDRAEQSIIGRQIRDEQPISAGHEAYSDCFLLK